MTENIVYNALLAAQSVDGMKWTYFTPMTRTEGGKVWFRGSTICCFWSGPRGIARLPLMVYAAEEDGVHVNLFERGSLRWDRGGREIRIEQDTDYPAAGAARFTIRIAAPDGIRRRYSLALLAGGAPLTVILTPFAAAGNGDEGNRTTFPQRAPAS